MIPKLHSWLAPSQALALVASPRLRLQHYMTSSYANIVHNVNLAKWTLGQMFFCWVLVHPTMPRLDFIVYNDMDMHLVKLRLCFQKCKEFGISLNLDKCAFMVISRMILGFIVSKECKLPNPKKIQTMVQIHVPINPQQIHVFNRIV